MREVVEVNAFEELKDVLSIVTLWMKTHFNFVDGETTSMEIWGHCLSLWKSNRNSLNSHQRNIWNRLKEYLESSRVKEAIAL